MMKTIFIIFVCNIISINFITGYPNQKCYICETNGCIYPAESDIKDCSDSNNNDGKFFVYGALGGNNANNIYTEIAGNLTSFGKQELSLNDTTMPSWNSLTRWVNFFMNFTDCIE